MEKSPFTTGTALDGAISIDTLDVYGGDLQLTLIFRLWGPQEDPILNKEDSLFLNWDTDKYNVTKKR